MAYRTVTQSFPLNTSFDVSLKRFKNAVELRTALNGLNFQFR